VRLTKYSHACVRLERDGGVLVIDPGIWTEPEAAGGADAVLVTHWHADHADRDGLAGLDVDVYGPRAGGVIPVGPGDRFETAGFRIRAVGGRHAAVYGGQPDMTNVGYVVDGAYYHPGDSFHVPDRAGGIRVLLVPVQGSWMKIGEAADFANAIGAERVIGMHEGQLNARGLAAANGWLGRAVPRYRYLGPGEFLDPDERGDGGGGG
jgi:L-ascorbate metabolism protein UlaG (beta-lactamase superfamily)